MALILFEELLIDILCATVIFLAAALLEANWPAKVVTKAGTLRPTSTRPTRRSKHTPAAPHISQHQLLLRLHLIAFHCGRVLLHRPDLPFCHRYRLYLLIAWVVAVYA